MGSPFSIAVWLAAFLSAPAWWRCYQGDTPLAEAAIRAGVAFFVVWVTVTVFAALVEFLKPRDPDDDPDQLTS